MASIEAISILLAVFLGVAGFVMWAFGWRLYRFFIIVTGILVGGTAGAIAGFMSDVDALVWAGLAAGALVGGLIAWPVHRFFVFLYGLLFGFLIGAVIGVAAGSEEMVFAAGAVLGLTCGVLALIFEKFFVILFTSFGGALYMVLGGAQLFDAAPDIAFLFLAPALYVQRTMMLLGFVALLGTIGIVIQYRTKGTTLANAGGDLGLSPQPVPSVEGAASTTDTGPSHEQAANAAAALPSSPTTIPVPLMTSVDIVPRTVAPFRRFQCPRCANIISVGAGAARARCTNAACGFEKDLPQ